MKSFKSSKKETKGRRFIFFWVGPVDFRFHLGRDLGFIRRRGFYSSFVSSFVSSFGGGFERLSGHKIWHVVVVLLGGSGGGAGSLLLEVLRQFPQVFKVIRA